VKFITLVKLAEGGPRPPASLFQAIAKLGEDAQKAGVLVEMGGLKPTSYGASVRLDKGKVTVMDGPFAEGKEVIGGYSIYDVKDKQAAMEWTQRFVDLHREHWPECVFEVELRQMMDGPPPV
jgi:hypothetical protein